jgi:hypothetical protein
MGGLVIDNATSSTTTAQFNRVIAQLSVQESLRKIKQAGPELAIGQNCNQSRCWVREERTGAAVA